MSNFQSTKIIELGSCAFRQPNATSHCKNIHGYRLIAKIWVGANSLDDKNWVFDFGGFKELTAILQKTFDHKLVIDKKDPAKPAFKELQRYGAAEIVEMDGVGIEKFAEFVFNTADTFIKFASNSRAWCDKVEVFEHEKNSAIFSKPVQQIEIKDIPKPLQEVTQVQPTSTPAPPPPVIQPPVKSGPKPAPLTNSVTTGWSNPFAGTSWGA